MIEIAAKSSRVVRLQTRLVDVWATAFEQQDVAPHAMVATDTFTRADDAEPRGSVQGKAGLVVGEDPRLDGPDAGGLGRADQRGEQSPTDGVAEHPPEKGLYASGVDSARFC